MRFDTLPAVMAGDVRKAAMIWAKGAMRNPAQTRLIRARYDALFTQSLSAGGLDTVTNATKNSVTMGKAIGLTVIETLEALGMAVDWIEAGAIPCQSRSLGRF